MDIIFTVTYHEDVVGKDIPKLPAIWRNKIKKAIENKLVTSPEIFGKPLRNSLKGYRSLRVGDYRVIFRIDKRIIKVFIIAHRSSVYMGIMRRMKEVI